MTRDTIHPAARAELEARIARAAEFRTRGLRAARPATKPEAKRPGKNGRAR